MFPTVPPSTARSRTGLGAQLVGTIVLVVVVLGAALTVVTSSTSAWFPHQWDPRVAPIAAEVARLRGLDFKHPVAIRFLAPAEFEKEVTGDPSSLSSTDRAEADRETADFRALGFIDGNVDLVKAFTTATSSGTLAYYSYARKDIVVRGTTFDVAHQVTVAHELTHVLQDQHFNLTKLADRAVNSPTGDSGAFRALVEGDAVRIENKYLKTLSAADQREYDRENAAEGARVGKESASVPDVVQYLFGAPYEFGPATARVLVAAGGHQGIDDALVGPVPSTALFVRPGDLTPPPTVADPALPAGATAVGDSEAFGAFETYLTLGTAIDPSRALDAADVVTTGRARTYRAAGRDCYEVTLVPRRAASRAFLDAAVRSWVATRPAAAMLNGGKNVTFRTCDPGKRAVGLKKARLTAIDNLLGVRGEFTASIAEAGAPAVKARCTAHVFAHDRPAMALVLAIGNNQPTGAQEAEVETHVRDAAEQCLANDDAQLH